MVAVVGADTLMPACKMLCLTANLRNSVSRRKLETMLWSAFTASSKKLARAPVSASSASNLAAADVSR